MLSSLKRGSSFSVLLLFLNLLASPSEFSTGFAQANRDLKPFETGGFSTTSATRTAPSEIKIISYNIRWRSGEELSKISAQLKGNSDLGGATIIGLQEVDRHKKRTGYANTVRALAEDLGMFYAWAAPPPAKGDQEEETGVAILSVYPLTDVQRIVLPYEGPGGRRRLALGASVKIGETSIRIYSVHAETRIPIKNKLDQMRAVLDDLAHYPKISSAIVLGDFNTWEANAAEETSRLFKEAGFVTPFSNDEPTFFRKTVLLNIELKLDWIWLRGLEPVSHGIDRMIDVSDHWPLWSVVKIKPDRKPDQR